MVKTKKIIKKKNYEQINIIRKTLAGKIPDNILDEIMRSDSEEGEFGSVTGVVDLIATFSTFTVKGIADDDGNITYFYFPPNTAEQCNELKRAQNHKKRVKVDYHLDATGRKIIFSVTVYN